MKQCQGGFPLRGVQVLTAGVLFLALFFRLPVSADARTWKPTPRQMIGDYSMIHHQRGPLEIVMLMWNVAEANAESPPVAIELMRKYMFLGVIHMRLNQLGQMNFQTATNVRVQLNGSKGSKARKPIDKALLPPAAIGYLSVLKSIMIKNLGAAGQGLHVFVFDSTGIAACGQGNVWVWYAGEWYLYQLPFPGCDQLHSAPQK